MWKKFNFSVLLLALLLPSVPVFATGSMQGWEYHREIYSGGDGSYKAFFLDDNVYRHARDDLADLRITGNDGGFVPYYIHTGTEAENITEIFYLSSLENSFKKHDDTFLDFLIYPLHENADITGNKLLFSLPQLNFLKNIELYGSHDGNAWEFIQRDMVYRIDNLSKNVVLLPETKKYGFYRVKIIDNTENITLGLELAHSFREKEFENYQRSAVLPYDVKQEGSYTYLTMDNSNRLKIKSIELAVHENFQRVFEVYGDYQVLLYRGELYTLQFSDYNIKNTRISFGPIPAAAEEIIIRISNLDNQPLDIAAVSVEYLVDKIVFEDIGSSGYRLYYGNQQASKPRYEIELYKSHVEREDQDFVTLGTTVRREETGPDLPAFRLDYVFNVIIGLISLLLVLFLAKKLSVRE